MRQLSLTHTPHHTIDPQAAERYRGSAGLVPSLDFCSTPSRPEAKTTGHRFTGANCLPTKMSRTPRTGSGAHLRPGRTRRPYGGYCARVGSAASRRGRRHVNLVATLTTRAENGVLRTWMQPYVTMRFREWPGLQDAGTLNGHAEHVGRDHDAEDPFQFFVLGIAGNEPDLDHLRRAPEFNRNTSLPSSARLILKCPPSGSCGHST
jgi:hypothetical protein